MYGTFFKPGPSVTVPGQTLAVGGGVPATVHRIARFILTKTGLWGDVLQLPSFWSLSLTAANSTGCARTFLVWAAGLVEGVWVGWEASPRPEASQSLPPKP